MNPSTDLVVTSPEAGTALPGQETGECHCVALISLQNMRVQFA